MKKLILAVIIAVGLLHSAHIQAMGAAAAAAGAGAQKEAKETVESTAKQLMKWVTLKVPQENLHTFETFINKFSILMLQLGVVNRLYSSPSLKKQATALADDLRDDALKIIPKDMTSIYSELKRELEKSKLILHDGVYEHAKAYEILHQLSLLITADLNSQAAAGAPGGPAMD